jgi:hypothetical protein
MVYIIIYFFASDINITGPNKIEKGHDKIRPIKSYRDLATSINGNTTAGNLEWHTFHVHDQHGSRTDFEISFQ